MSNQENTPEEILRERLALLKYLQHRHQRAIAIPFKAGNWLIDDIKRVAENAALRRQDLLDSGLNKSYKKKLLGILAGMLSLLSAGAITVVLADLFGDKGIQMIAAIVAGISGVLSLVVAAYFSDDEIFNMLEGSARYLALRESANRLMIHPHLNEEERFAELIALHDEYVKLDGIYSRYFRRCERSDGTPTYPTPRSWGRGISIGDAKVPKDDKSRHADDKETNSPGDTDQASS